MNKKGRTLLKKVDIVIPAYNPGAYLKDAIESVLSQTYKDYNLFVIDDCSTENIENITRFYPSVNLLKTDKNSGPSAARNLGIKAGSAEFISFLDSDDIMHKEKLEKSISVLEKKPEVGMTCGNYRIVYNRKALLKPFYKNPVKIDHKLLMRQNFVASGSTTVRRSVLDEVGLFDESLWISEDYDLWVRISEKYKIEYIHDILYYYSVFPSMGSLTNKPESSEVGRKNNLLIRKRSIERMRNSG